MSLVNPLLAMGTPCRLSLEVVFNADSGEYGRFWVERLVTWPGVPMLEQTYCETGTSGLRPDAYKLKSINFDGDSDEIRLLVFLQDIDVSKWIRTHNELAIEQGRTPLCTVLDREIFIEVIHEYLDFGWTLMLNEARWWQADDVLQPDAPERYKRVGEQIRFDEHGNVADDDDFDDDEDDDDDE